MDLIPHQGLELAQPNANNILQQMIADYIRQQTYNAMVRVRDRAVSFGRHHVNRYRRRMAAFQRGDMIGAHEGNIQERAVFSPEQEQAYQGYLGMMEDDPNSPLSQEDYMKAYREHDRYSKVRIAKKTGGIIYTRKRGVKTGIHIRRERKRKANTRHF